MLATQSAAAAMQAHDELAALLARSLTLNPASIPVPGPGGSTTAGQTLPAEQPQIVYSISQHYHHSAHHVVRPPNGLPQQEQQQPQRPQEPESAQATPQEQMAARQLIQSGIDPASLTPVQLALFQMAAPDRREYLVQLWRIYPPGTSGTSGAAAYNPVTAAAAAAATPASWDGTSRAAQQEETMSLDGTAVSVAPQQAAATQAADGRWLQAASQSYMEPYMLSGYEQLARRDYLASAAAASGADRDSDGLASIPRSSQTATDPVYGNRLDASSWPPAHQAAAAMEYQYGALMAIRDGGEMEL